MASPDITRRLKVAPLEGSRLKVGLTLSEIEEFCGFVAAEANHIADRRLGKRLDRVSGKLKKCEERYEDELSTPID
jgi:hypothetical protein